MIIDLSGETSECKGRFYRVTKSAYVASNGGYKEDIGFLLLKRISCKGCSKCGWEEDHIKESISCYGYIPTLTSFNDGDTAKYIVRGTNNYYGDWDIDSEGFDKFNEEVDNE